LFWGPCAPHLTILDKGPFAQARIVKIAQLVARPVHPVEIVHATLADLKQSNRTFSLVSRSWIPARFDQGNGKQKL